MIHSIEIENFRCFRRLQTNKCRRFNIIVGDNGAGKTSLLEAIFLALGSSPELAIRFRGLRGLGGSFNSSPFRIEEAIWRDLFYKRQWNAPISIRLSGDGVDNRSVTVSRGDQSELPIPPDVSAVMETTTPQRSGSLLFEWTNAAGIRRQSRPAFTPQGFVYGSPEEDLQDFFYFAANHNIGAEENAARFSELGFEGRRKEFIDFFANEYPWISDLTIEIVAGSPTIYATMQGEKDQFPLAMVSGGINRILSISLALASHQRAVVLVDEIENGIYHKHQPAVWRGLASLARRANSQLFITTHNEEWLSAVFVEQEEIDDVTLWRLERSSEGPRLKQFSGKQASVAVQSEGEIR